MSDELKPCPFCGGKAQVQKSFTDPFVNIVTCAKCFASTGYDHTPAMVIEKWNTRYDPQDRSETAARESVQIPVERLRHGLERIANCGQSVEPDHWKFRKTARGIAEELLALLPEGGDKKKQGGVAC